MPQPNQDPESVLAEEVNSLSASFDALCIERLKIGAEQYGQFNFLKVDTLTMALEELVDLANYARFTYIRIQMLAHKLKKEQDEIELGRLSDFRSGGLG